MVSQIPPSPVFSLFICDVSRSGRWRRPPLLKWLYLELLTNLASVLEHQQTNTTSPIIAVFILYFVYLFIFWREVCRVQVVYDVYCRSVAAFYSMLHSYWPNPYISSLRFQSYVCTAGWCVHRLYTVRTHVHTLQRVSYSYVLPVLGVGYWLPGCLEILL